VPAIAWFTQSSLSLLLAAILVIGLVVAFWSRRTGEALSRRPREAYRYR
jgi:hypothetical protein